SDFTYCAGTHCVPSHHSSDPSGLVWINCGFVGLCIVGAPVDGADGVCCCAGAWSLFGATKSTSSISGASPSTSNCVPIRWLQTTLAHCFTSSRSILVDKNSKYWLSVVYISLSVLPLCLPNGTTICLAVSISIGRVWKICSGLVNPN